MSTIPKPLIQKLESHAFKTASDMPIVLLEKVVLSASDAYYNSDVQLLSDDTFDIIIDVLKSRSPTSDVLGKIGAKIPDSAPGKTVLPYHLGSMDKVKPGERPLELWLSRYTGPYIISEKLDGLSGLLIIKVVGDGKHAVLEQHLYRRGDDDVSQEVSHMLGFINTISRDSHANLIKIITSLNPKTRILAIRGEIIIKKATFANKYAGDYPKARSLIAGITNSIPETFNRAEVRAKAHDLDYVAYTVLDPPGLSQQQQFDIIKSAGFTQAHFKSIPTLDQDMLKELLLEFKSNSKYEIDGIIVADESRIHPLPTSGNPKYAVAFKMRLEDQMAKTTVEYVEYNVTKNKLLKPRVKFTPVKIGGDTIMFATGFNAKFIKDNCLGPGAQISVIKSGDVIPYILEVHQHAKTGKWQEPDIPYIWSDGGIDISPKNMTDAPEYLNRELLHFFTTLGVDGIKEGTLDKLITAGFNTINSIVSIKPESLINIQGFQVKSAQKLVDNIRSTIHEKSHKLSVIMTASNIFTGFGVKKLDIICNNLPYIRILGGASSDRVNTPELTIADITALDGFSDKTATVFLANLPKFRKWFREHPGLNILKPDPASHTPVVAKPSNAFLALLVGKKIVFTGFRDVDLETRLTQLGVKIQSGVNSTTNLVVAADPNESSSKITKAQELNISIISRDTFLDRIK